MSLIVVYNLKGGVGKTTSVVNLSWVSAQQGPTLVWDLDPQSAASFYFRVQPQKKAGGKHIFEGLDGLIHETNYPNLDLIPGSFTNRKLGNLLVDQPAKTLKKLLKPLAAQYDWIWVDAPPTASELAAHLFWAADILLVPLIPTPLSIRAYETISLWLQKKKGSLRSVRPFFNLVDMRKSLHRRLVSEYRMDHPEFLETLIPQAAAVEKMGEECQPLLMFAPSHPAAHQYQALFRELAVAQQVDL